MAKKFVIMAALVLMLAPASARADWLFTPNIGGSFGGSASGNEHLTYGATIGWMGAGIFGFEADFAFTPEFFESGDGDIDFFDSSNVTSFMANAVIGIPIGCQVGPGFRPYVSGGIGVLQQNIESAGELFSINNDEFGVNIGFGAMGFATDHVGFRGDVRYYRALTDPDSDNEFDIALGDFDFWRGTVGVTFRW
jgi:opacity protein-like surface antigen